LRTASDVEDDVDRPNSSPGDLRMIVRRIDFGCSRSENTTRAVREAKSPRRPFHRAAAAEGVREDAHSA
jgi:hypothetical protein